MKINSSLTPLASLVSLECPGSPGQLTLTPLVRAYALLLGALIALLWCIGASAEEKQREAAKTGPIKQIMAKKQFNLSQPGKPFCVQFLNDFKTLNGIKFIDPMVHAESYDSATLASFKARCGEQPLNERFECDRKATAEVGWQKDSIRRRQQYLEYCGAFYGTRNFRVFQIDANNNPKDGKEIVVYFEGARGPLNRPSETTITGDGGYYAYSERACAPVANVATHDPYNYFLKRPVDNYNGVVLYHDKYYVFDLFALNGTETISDDPQYQLNVSTLNSDRREWCSYSSLSIRRAIEENRAKRAGK